MVLSLEQVRHIEDKNLLAGHTLVLLERDTAQAQVRGGMHGLAAWGRAGEGEWEKLVTGWVLGEGGGW